MKTEHIPIEQLALYWSRDLGGDSRAIETHLAHCGACRTALEELDRCQRLLARCGPEPSEQDRLALHNSVLSKIQSQPRRPRIWVWGTAAAAAALMLLLFRAFTREPRQSADLPRSSFVAVLQPIRLTLPLPPRMAVPHRAIRSGLRSVALITRSDAPPIVKMTTSDPKVVILLQIGNAQPQERTEINE